MLIMQEHKYFFMHIEKDVACVCMAAQFYNFNVNHNGKVSIKRFLKVHKQEVHAHMQICTP